MYETCEHCGGPMQGGRAAIACAPGGKSATIRLPLYCPDRDCQERRDDSLIRDLIARGVIDP